jgi:beta-glucosidase
MLKGFARVHIASGETITQTFRLSAEDLAVFGSHQQWQVEPGKYRLAIGGSSDSLKQEEEFEVHELILLGRH